MQFSPDLYRFKLSASAGSEGTPKTSQGISSLAAICQVPTYLCGRVEFQGVIRLQPEEFIRPEQTNIDHEKERVCTNQACGRILAPSYNHITQFVQEPSRSWSSTR